MRIINKDKCVASFKLGDKYIQLIPNKMIKNAFLYHTEVEQIHAKLTIIPHTSYFYEIVTELENRGNTRSKQITDFFGADITIDEELFGKNIFWNSINGDCNSIDSYLPRSEAVNDGQVLEMNAYCGRSSWGRSFPYFDLHGDNCEQNTLLIAIGWTGQWLYRLKRENGTIRFTAGLEDCDFYLEPGETVRSVSVMFCTGKGVTQTRQLFRKTLREKLSPAAKTGGKLELPLAMQVFDRYFWNRPSWRTEKEQLQCLDAALNIGYFDTYWLDAAWFTNGFPNVGNYSYDKGFPNGLSFLSKKAHENGLKFVLWFEPERCKADSEVAKEHPSFLLTRSSEPDKEYGLNLAKDEVTDWLIEKLSKIIYENGVDIYRQDCNYTVLQNLRYEDSKTPGRKGYTEIKYYTNLYRMWDTISARFPGLLIDNCSSGGTRLDVELMRRSVSLWRSDVSCGPATEEKPVHAYNQNQTLGLSRYLPYHCASTWATDAYTVRSASTMGLATAFDVLDEKFDFDEPKPALEEFVRLRRYWDGDFWPLTEGTKDMDCWSGFQLSLGKNEGMCEFFRRQENTESSKVFRLNDIDSDAMYEVSITDEKRNTVIVQKAGRELESGLTINIPYPVNSVVLEYKKV